MHPEFQLYFHNIAETNGTVNYYQLSRKESLTAASHRGSIAFITESSVGGSFRI
jgi:hypothetical protein